MMRLLRILLALLPLFALVAPPSAVAASPGGGNGERSCDSLKQPDVPGARVLSFTADPKEADPLLGVPAYCDVSVELTHPGEHDRVLVQVWLPLTRWNGRFQGTGGGGFSSGFFARALAPAVANGYAAASTDGGHGPDMGGPPTWALDEHGRVDTGLLLNFASRSVHDMTVVGKTVTARFYGRPATHSYWNGCSGGGRQGLMEAQRHPTDYDGILAGAPAINWPRFLVAAQWPQVVMQQEHTFLTACEFEAVNAAAIEACDARDGVRDGVVEEPAHCDFDPHSLVGTTLDCDGVRRTITADEAAVVRKIWDGPATAEGVRLWHGISPGTSFAALAGTVIRPDGTIVGSPFYLPDNWIRYFLAQDPDFDTSQITYRDFPRIFQRSYARYNRVIGTDDPDLSRFAAAGGKLLVWHGLADQLIFPGGTVDYRERVDQALGGTQRVDQFFRLFLAPGVDHCGGGRGPVPSDPLAALVDWVEHGRAPDTLPAATTDPAGGAVTRNLCRYPLVSTYDGHGDPKSAASYRCRPPVTAP
jgi:Tannase and feruloyl esterase